MIHRRKVIFSPQLVIKMPESYERSVVALAVSAAIAIAAAVTVVVAMAVCVSVRREGSRHGHAASRGHLTARPHGQHRARRPAVGAHGFDPDPQAELP